MNRKIKTLRQSIIKQDCEISVLKSVLKEIRKLKERKNEKKEERYLGGLEKKLQDFSSSE